MDALGESPVAPGDTTMAKKANVKFIQEVPTEGRVVAARRPFRVEQDNRRRFVRIEIASPVTINKIRDAAGQFWPEGDWHLINGTILNISAGGLLVEVDQQVYEGDIVSLHFIMQDVEALNDVLGLVKRVDSDQDGLLAGIEFITREQLTDLLSQGEVDMLPSTLDDFDHTVHRVLSRYVFEEQPTAMD
ncbi:hypothetical protein GF420_02945 [candidate division GN15 bacterium]|nr:hypothetical protein [candidate division GN15 bacterium]